MTYTAELEHLIKILRKMRVQAVCMQMDRPLPRNLDMGLRKMLGLEANYSRIFQPDAKWMQGNTIYKIVDRFLCNYIVLLLPDPRETTVFLIGPYLTQEKSQAQLVEEAERYAVLPKKFTQLKRIYSDIPVVSDESWLFAMFNVLGETLWGKDSDFSIVESRQEEVEEAHAPPEEIRDAEEIILHIKSMENRYEYENRLMELVSQGLTHRAVMMLSRFSHQALEQRSASEVRNVKNYTIICNTLLRKAAERGGVHPVFLDRASSEFAIQVESIVGAEDGMQLMQEMVKTYCGLVRQHSIRRYSPLVQTAVTYIETDLTGDLSLRALSAMQNVNPSYFSTLFHKETGKTITEYVTQRRMDMAARLLSSTHLQVQTVAQHCGMSDVNYFSKVFKRHFGVSPKQFRENRDARPPKWV